MHESRSLLLLLLLLLLMQAKCVHNRHHVSCRCCAFPPNNMSNRNPVDTQFIAALDTSRNHLIAAVIAGGNRRCLPSAAASDGGQSAGWVVCSSAAPRHSARQAHTETAEDDDDSTRAEREVGESCGKRILWQLHLLEATYAWQHCSSREAFLFEPCYVVLNSSID
jgi:hypothetical protein